MADHPLRIVVHCEAHQPRDYFVGLVLCSFMDYADVRLCGIHRHPADLVLHQTKTPNPLTPEPMNPIKITYQFKNKVEAEFTYQESEEGLKLNCEWSCAFTKKNIGPLWDEYVNQCVPRVYQELANLSGREIMWVDKTGKEGIMVFQPINP